MTDFFPNISKLIFLVFILLAFLSFYLKSKYIGEKQKLFRNILYVILLILACLIIFQYKLDLDIPGFLLVSYFVGLFLYMIILPTFIDKYSIKKRFIILAILGLILFLIFFFSPFL